VLARVVEVVGGGTDDAPAALSAAEPPPPAGAGPEPPDGVPPDPPDGPAPPGPPEPSSGRRFGRSVDTGREAALPPPMADVSSSGMSMPVRPLTVVEASARVRVVVFTTSDAPSLERTVRLSMWASGSAAARTISGSIERTVEMIAASLNWR